MPMGVRCTHPGVSEMLEWAYLANVVADVAVPISSDFSSVNHTDEESDHVGRHDVYRNRTAERLSIERGADRSLTTTGPPARTRGPLQYSVHASAPPGANGKGRTPFANPASGSSLVAEKRRV
jgi:hypothetical protein